MTFLFIMLFIFSISSFPKVGINQTMFKKHHVIFYTWCQRGLSINLSIENLSSLFKNVLLINDFDSVLSIESYLHVTF